ncbi:AN1-type zinc finger protein 6 [Hippoglossus hippoglossus]|uniref:AN1-type zinc finger protein 6 n=1 Tax=Hippoglossus hippoglossus TaxID=8267 RepID=UPI00148D3CF0|nr:AN1-type zinc finger protein 6 [Hippoglossus hippoglossus]
MTARVSLQHDRVISSLVLVNTLTCVNKRITDMIRLCENLYLCHSQNCGFYSSPRSNGMCSVCYKAFLQRQQQQTCQPNSSASCTGSSGRVSQMCSHIHKKPKLEDPHEEVVLSGASESEVSVGTSVEAEKKPKAKKNRCLTCRKKVGLTGFDCRCGNIFCSTHRYSDRHNCTFDYKADAVERLKKENPVVGGEKIQKI